MKKLFLSMLCCSTLLFVSCEHESEKPYVQTESITAKEYFEKKRESAKQEFEVNTSELPKTFQFKEKVKITIPENALLKDGKPITGKFTLEVYEMLKPSSIVFSGTNTNYDWGRYLETDGFVYVNVKQNGSYIDDRLGENITISIPTEKNDSTLTELWRGSEQAGENENQFAWQAIDSEDLVWQGETVGTGEFQQFNRVWSNNKSFNFIFGKLGWCNCDVIWGEDDELTTVTVALTGKVGTLASFMAADGDTYVFFCSKTIPVLAQLYTKVNNTTVKSYDDSMPVGASGKMFAFSIRKGAISFASQDITITKDMQLTLDLKEISQESLDKNIKELDTYTQ